MTVIYRERKKGQCPHLTDGKEYIVEDTVTIPDEGDFYMILDGDENEYGDACPYPIAMFEIKRDIYSI